MKRFNFIYKTTNLTNGKIYIGKHSTDNLDDGYLGSGKYLKQSIKKYGKNNFISEVIEFADSELRLKELEKYYISLYNSTDINVGYNIVIGSSGVSTHKMSSRQKTSNTMKGRVKTDLHLQHISEALTGRKLPDYVVQKLRGKKRSEEFRKKISIINKGRKHTEETRIRISKSNKGKKLSLETRHKMSKSHTGKVSNRKGVILSEETKQKMSIARKLYWEKRKKEVI